MHLAPRQGVFFVWVSHIRKIFKFDIAKLAGFSSPTYWRLVSEGKSNLSRVSMNRMISAMGLAGFEADYFKALVNFCNAKGDDAKMPYWKEMRQIAKTCCNEISTADVSKSLEFLTKAGFLKKRCGRLVLSDRKERDRVKGRLGLCRTLYATPNVATCQ